MAKSHLKLVTPAALNRTVTPKRPSNADLRTREYLTEAEVERLINAATGMCASLSSITAASCNNNFTCWDIGSETIFNLDSNTYVGLDLVYQNLNTASSGAIYAPTGATVSDQHAFFGQFRVHRNFYP